MPLAPSSATKLLLKGNSIGYVFVHKRNKNDLANCVASVSGDDSLGSHFGHWWPQHCSEPRGQFPYVLSDFSQYQTISNECIWCNFQFVHSSVWSCRSLACVNYLIKTELPFNLKNDWIFRYFKTANVHMVDMHKIICISFFKLNFSYSLNAATWSDYTSNLVAKTFL